MTTTKTERIDSFVFAVQPSGSEALSVSKTVDMTSTPLFDHGHSGGAYVLFGDGSVRTPDGPDTFAAGPDDQVTANLLLPYTDFDLG